MEDRTRRNGMVRIVMVLAVAILVASCSTPLSTREKGALAGGQSSAARQAIRAREPSSAPVLAP